MSALHAFVSYFSFLFVFEWSQLNLHCHTAGKFLRAWPGGCCSNVVVRARVIFLQALRLGGFALRWRFFFTRRGCLSDKSELRYRCCLTYFSFSFSFYSGATLGTVLWHRRSLQTFWHGLFFIWTCSRVSLPRCSAYIYTHLCTPVRWEIIWFPYSPDWVLLEEVEHLPPLSRCDAASRGFRHSSSVGIAREGDTDRCCG
jgi:hypothetical protein